MKEEIILCSQKSNIWGILTKARTDDPPKAAALLLHAATPGAVQFTRRISQLLSELGIPVIRLCEYEKGSSLTDVILTVHSASPQLIVIGLPTHIEDVLKIATQNERISGIAIIDAPTFPGFRYWLRLIGRPRILRAWLLRRNNPLVKPVSWDSSLREKFHEQLSSLKQRGVHALFCFTAGSLHSLIHASQFFDNYPQASRKLCTVRVLAHCDPELFFLRPRNELAKLIHDWVAETFVSGV